MVFTLFSGVISLEAQAAQGINDNLYFQFFMIATGISFAASAFTGNYLGRNRIDLGKRFSRMSLLFGCLIAVVIVLGYRSFHDEIYLTFTSDETTLDILKSSESFIPCFFVVEMIHVV